jgi:hypothetical protein
MKRAKIEVAPENGGLIVLLDAYAWKLGRRATDANGGVQRDGTSVRISPTQSTRLSYDVAASDRERLLSLTPTGLDDEQEHTQKRSLTPLILGLAIAIFCIGGYGFWIGSNADGFAADQEREFSRIRNRAYVATAGLAAALEHDNASLTESLESKRIANSQKTESKQGLNEKEVSSEALSHVLVSARENEVAARNPAAAHERDNILQALKTEEIADAAHKGLKQAHGESEKRVLALEGELTSARQTIDSAEKPPDAETTARDAASPTGPLNRPMRGSHIVSETVGSMPSPQSRSKIPAGERIFSEARPDHAIPGAYGPLTQSKGSQPDRPQSPSAMSSVEEAKLVARADFLIKQFDFASARLLLAHAIDKGSARAAFMMAETYDWQILRSLQAYGMRGDAKMARNFYQLAAKAGIEKARERVEALQLDANADMGSGGEERSR